MKPPARIEFLERDNYRQRRFRDAAHFVPVFGAVLMLLPLMWPREATDQSLTSSGMIYLFGLWIVLIFIALALSRALRFEVQKDDKETGE
jgi:hypothetical protein